MAYDVNFSIPQRTLGNADVKFAVWKNGEKLGTLAVSKGAVVWFPRNYKWGHKVGWTKFDRIIAEEGTRWERR
jgi:hypothetical protein